MGTPEKKASEDFKRMRRTQETVKLLLWKQGWLEILDAVEGPQSVVGFTAEAERFPAPVKMGMLATPFFR